MLNFYGESKNCLFLINLYQFYIKVFGLSLSGLCSTLSMQIVSFFRLSAVLWSNDRSRNGEEQIIRRFVYSYEEPLFFHFFSFWHLCWFAQVLSFVFLYEYLSRNIREWAFFKNYCKKYRQTSNIFGFLKIFSFLIYSSIIQNIQKGSCLGLYLLHFFVICRWMFGRRRSRKRRKHKHVNGCPHLIENRDHSHDKFCKDRAAVLVLGNANVRLAFDVGTKFLDQKIGWY